MKKIRFTLQAVKTLRDRQEQVAREQYAQAVQARQLALNALAAVLNEREAAWQLRRDRGAAGAPAGHLQQVQEYITALESLKARCEQAVQETERVVTAKWEQFKLARQAREAVDKFHARQLARHERAMRYEDQKMLDDLAQRRTLSTAPMSLAQG